MATRTRLAIAMLGIGITTGTIAAHAKDPVSEGIQVTHVLGAVEGPSDDDPYAARSVRVRISDLDLATAPGRETMNGRVRRAVRTVCPAQTLQSVTEMMVNRACAKVARASARQPMLLAIARAERRQADRSRALAAFAAPPTAAPR